ncbi:MAG: protein translocase subunit SecD [Alphaproteobacteria bacterium]
MIHIARWKLVVSFVVVMAGILFVSPNLLTREQAASLPGWLSHSRINLGLDLQGGSHLLLGVDLQSVMRERLDNMVQGVREALRKERIGYTRLGVSGQTVVFQLTNPDDMAKVREYIRTNEPGIVLDAGPNGQVTLRYEEAALRERQNQIINQSIEIVRRRVDEFGTTEPSIQQQGEDRILLQVPGESDSDRIIRIISQTARLSFRLVDPTMSAQEARATGRIPAGSELLPSVEGRDLSGGAGYLVQRRIIIGGDNLVDAQPGFQNGEAVVNFRFDSAGGRRFGDVTRDNVGRPFAIVLDDKVISAPVIREPILGGSGVISGSFTTETARDLALLLRAGALPAPLQVLEQRVVGPDLGADSIAAGKIASIIGMIGVLVFMILAYGLFGVFANIALIVNVTLLMGAMSALNATLTLPGIAGIVLTIGMAVDANVLIYERIREETRNGRSIVSAIDAGFQRAWTTILDSNITTLIAGLVMFELGSGPIRGFAVTLSIGIVTSIFTAVMVTRFIIIGWLRWRQPKILPI